MNNVLQQIIEKKLEDMAQTEQIDASELELVTLKTDKTDRTFRTHMLKGKRSPGLIAEIKLASPSKLFVQGDFDIATRAKEYEAAGADAISVVVEKHFFKGDITFVPKV